MSDFIERTKRIDKVEKILLFCHLDPTVKFRTMAKLIVMQLESEIKNDKNEQH